MRVSGLVYRLQQIDCNSIFYFLTTYPAHLGSIAKVLAGFYRLPASEKTPGRSLQPLLGSSSWLVFQVLVQKLRHLPNRSDPFFGIATAAMPTILDGNKLRIDACLFASVH